MSVTLNLNIYLEINLSNLRSSSPAMAFSEARYYDIDINVEGNVSVSSRMSDSEMEFPESEARYVYRVEYAGAISRPGLLTTYCVVPLGDGSLHSIQSKDLRNCLGETIFEDSLLENASSRCTYEAHSQQEVAVVTALAENDCSRSDLVRGYPLEWGLAWQRGWDIVISNRLYRHEVRIVDIWVSVSDFLRGTGMPIVYVGLEWDHSPEVMWLSALDATYYLDDWFIGMLIDFLDNSVVVDEEMVDLVYEASNHCLPL